MRPLVVVGVAEPVSHGRLVLVVVRVGRVVPEDARYGRARAALLPVVGPRALPHDAVLHVPLGEQVERRHEQRYVHAVLLRHADHRDLVRYVDDGRMGGDVAEAVLRVELTQRVQHQVQSPSHDDAVELAEYLLVQLVAVDRRDEELLASRAVRLAHQIGDVVGYDERRYAREVLDVLGVVQVICGDNASRAARDVQQQFVECSPLRRFWSRLFVADRSDDDHRFVERHESLAHGHWQRAHERRHSLHRLVVPVHFVELSDHFGCQSHPVLLGDDFQVLGAGSDVSAVVG